MKSLILFFLLLCSTISYSKESSVERALQSVSNGIDSTKTAIKQGAAFVDTSTVSKELYHDFSNGIKAMAESLKVGAEHVYKVLIKQQIVNSISKLFIFSLFIIIYSIITYKIYFFCAKYDDEGWVLFVFSCIFLFASVILFSLNFTDIVTGFLNPEYGAMKDIVNMANDIKNGKTTCNSCQ